VALEKIQAVDRDLMAHFMAQSGCAVMTFGCKENPWRILARHGVFRHDSLMAHGALKGEPMELLELIDETPSTWSGPHVGRRLCEAMRVLRLLPMPGVTGYQPAWPAYAYEFEDLLAQHEQGELERTQQQQNRTRLLPSLREITACEAVIVWPACYLRGRLEIAQATNSVALAHALDRDAGWVAAKRGGYADTWRQRHDIGCEIIAARLRVELVPVF
jgi:hypothetical protein